MEREIKSTWVIMPVLAHREYTMAAISDVLAQTVPVRLLIVNQGVEDGFRDELERVAEADDRVLVWSHQPALPSLAATWNRALDCAWQAGGEEALVINNDVRIRSNTLALLKTVLDQTVALFVSCVGVRDDDYVASLRREGIDLIGDLTNLGGPDFSCFLISKDCHTRFRFDEGFIPAFCEDLDYHRRLMLAGEGARIFSVNLPYLHYASATLKALPTEQAAKVRQAIESGSRAYYKRKWGGPVNHETYWVPFSREGAGDVVFVGTEMAEVDPDLKLAVVEPTTPNLQAYVQRRPLDLHGLLAADPAADITGMEDWRQPRE